MYVIPINPATLDLIEVLNNGVRPAIEILEETFFLYKGENEIPEIINAEEFLTLKGPFEKIKIARQIG